eukprot:gene29028-34346_t
MFLPGVRGVADPSEVADKNGLRALHHAAFRGCGGLLRMLLNDGGEWVARPADPWRPDDTGLGGLPLNYAARMRHWDD